MVNELFILCASSTIAKPLFSIYLFQSIRSMNIKEHIKELLFTSQGVIIPGLGGFVSEYEPAAFDVNENKFLPPSKKITFNPEYSYHDAQLVEFIAKKEKAEKESVEKALADFVKDTKYKLKQGKTILFPEIGILSQKRGKISFAQSKESNLLTDSFGLKSIITKQPAQPVIQKPAKKPKSRKKVILIGAVAMVFIALCIFGWYYTEGFTNFHFLATTDTRENQTTEKNLKEITEKNLDSIAKADSLKALIVHSIDDNTDKKDALFYQEPEKQESKSPYSEFHIIAGSFKRMENAEKFSKQLRTKGYDPQIIKSGENLIRISIYSYTNETEALKELYKLRESSELRSVWILKSI
jgi:hypothetical protein